MSGDPKSPDQVSSKIFPERHPVFWSPQDPWGSSGSEYCLNHCYMEKQEGLC